MDEYEYEVEVRLVGSGGPGRGRGAEKYCRWVEKVKKIVRLRESKQKVKAAFSWESIHMKNMLSLLCTTTERIIIWIKVKSAPVQNVNVAIEIVIILSKLEVEVQHQKQI